MHNINNLAPFYGVHSAFTLSAKATRVTYPAFKDICKLRSIKLVPVMRSISSPVYGALWMSLHNPKQERGTRHLEYCRGRSHDWHQASAGFPLAEAPRTAGQVPRWPDGRCASQEPVRSAIVRRLAPPLRWRSTPFTISNSIGGSGSSSAVGGIVLLASRLAG